MLLQRLLRLPIVNGPLRGLWWQPGAGGKVIRLLSGGYEPRQAAALSEQIHPGAVFFDIGAHAGYYSLLASRRVGEAGRIFAFEPCPRNCWFLRRHVQVNRLQNVSVHHAAIGEFSGRARFQLGKKVSGGTATGRLSPQGEWITTVYRLDDFVLGCLQPRGRGQTITPTHLKIDVEGSELEVLRGAKETLNRFRPVVFLSTHSDSLRRACRQFLTDQSYLLQPLGDPDEESAWEFLCRPN